jgi:hypothetical protein
LCQDGGDQADGCGDAIDGKTHSVSEGKGHTTEASRELVECARPSMVDRSLVCSRDEVIEASVSSRSAFVAFVRKGRGCALSGDAYAGSRRFASKRKLHHLIH